MVVLPSKSQYNPTILGSVDPVFVYGSVTIVVGIESQLVSL